MSVDALELQRQRMQEAAAASERARQQNIRLFTELFLGLGWDCTKLAGTNHDQELAEARSLAAWRWNRLIDLESQIQREEQALAARPKQRPSHPGDAMAPDRTLAEWDSKWIAETEGLREQLKQLKAEAKQTRTELESFTKRGK